MELKNKKINFLGDSITEGAGATDLTRCYVEVLKKKYGLAEGRNYGIGGTRIARQRKPSEEPKFDRDFCSRVGEMDADADIVVVFGGTNDHGHGDAPLGTDSDRTADTFIGACHVLCASLLEKFPRSAIVVATPLHRAEEGRADGIALEDYVNLIRKIAGDYGLPVLDLYEQSAINTASLSRLTCDGLHPNDEGHGILAEEMGQYLQNL
jgi:lysophospholipase L1-like esterase